MKKKVKVDHYEVLGLPTAEEGTKLTEEDIRKAYLAKCKQVHPDKRLNDPNANEEFQQLKSSYDILKKNPKARKRFDASILKLTNKPSKPKPKTKREPPPQPRPRPKPKPKTEVPKPKPNDPPPSEPDRVGDDDNTRLIGTLGLLAFVFVPMAHPAARLGFGILLGSSFYILGFDLVTKREESECGWMYPLIIGVGQFCKRFVKRSPPDIQDSQEQDHEDIEDWVLV